MTFPDSVPLDPAELAARLRGAAPGELVVLTPNRRLAQSLESGYDAARAAEGLESWPAASCRGLGVAHESTLDDGDAAPLSEDQEARLGGNRGGGSVGGRASWARRRGSEARKAWAPPALGLEGALRAWKIPSTRRLARWPRRGNGA
jgi:hypothetical protein